MSWTHREVKPGVSTTQVSRKPSSAPAGRSSTWRVVFLPRRILRESSPVCMWASGQSVLISVDFPAPLGPVRTVVFPRRISFTSTRLSGIKLLIKRTVHPHAS